MAKQERMLGVPDAPSIDPADIKRIAASKPTQQDLAKFHPAVRDAVLKHLESKKSRKKKAPVPGIKLPKKKKAPVRRESPWVGKKVGKRAGAIQKNEDGTLSRVTKEEARASVTTELPRQEAPAPKPSGKMRTVVATGRTQVQPSNRGFARNPAQVGELLRQAIGHLENMKRTHGTEEYHQHHDAFNAVHATLQGADSRVHTLLGIAAHTVRNPNHPNADTHFTLSMKALRSKLASGTRVAGENAENARAGQARARAARIAAEQSKKEGNA